MSTESIEENKENKENKTFGQEAKEYFLEWLQNTTSHGIPNILRAKNIIIRILWTIFFVASVSYCGYVIVKNLIDYAKYETTVTIELIRESPTNFPSITLCNLNPFNEEKALRYIATKGQDIEGIKCFSNTFKNTDSEEQMLEILKECFKTRDTGKIFDIIRDRMKRIIANDELTDAERLSYGFDLYQDMLVSCKYNKAECSAAEFTPFWSNVYGACYSINSGLTGYIWKTSKTGKDYGLELELVVQPSTTSTIFAKTNGIYLVVKNQTISPLTLSGGTAVSPGFETYIDVKKTFTQKQKKPYSNCISDLTSFDSYSKRLYGYFADIEVSYYNQDLCVDLCYQDQLIDKCNCCDIITPAIRDASYCQSDAQIACMEEYDQMFSTVDPTTFCKGVCGEQCENQRFEWNVHLSLFPSNSYLGFASINENTAKFFPENDTAQFARESFLRVIINYNTLTYTSIEESPSATFEDLLGNLGGQLGLFIGISMLSFIEVLELISELCILYYYKKYKKRERPQNYYMKNWSVQQNPLYYNR